MLVVESRIRFASSIRPAGHHGPKPFEPEPPAARSIDRPGPKGRLGVALGLSVLGVAAGMATPAQAQVQLAPRPQPPLSLLDSLQSYPRAETRVTFSQVNDSMPAFLEPIVPAKDRVPGMNRADDDGWTAEVRSEMVRTQGDEQWVLAGRYSMLTQRGAWEPRPASYQSLRTDLTDVVLQKNFKEALSPNTDLVYGIGGGVQGLGPQGGHWVQQSFHIHGGFGGRLDPTLQHVYTTSSPTFYPEVTAGVGVQHRLDEAGQLVAKGALSASVAVGPGFNTVRAETGLEYSPWSRVTFEGGVSVSAVRSTHSALNFLDVNGVRPGAYVGAEVHITRGWHAFARVEANGVRNEPVYLVGVSFGGGPRPWLNPLW